MTRPVVVGIDPGGRTTGIITRRGPTLLSWALVESDGTNWSDYHLAVHDCIDGMIFDHAAELVCIEDLVDPNPHLGLANVRGLINTARVIGAVEAAFDQLVYVRPARHGVTPDVPKGRVLDGVMDQLYPVELLGRRERGGKYTGRLRHCRSAWSVAAAGERQSGRSVQQRFGLTT